MDSQSVRWGNNHSLNGIDGNKKVKGIKRHVEVDKNGFLISVMVTVANVHDSKAAFLLIRVLKELCSSVKVILADGGYRGDIIEQAKPNVYSDTPYRLLLVPTRIKALGQFTKGGL